MDDHYAGPCPNLMLLPPIPPHLVLHLVATGQGDPCGHHRGPRLLPCLWARQPMQLSPWLHHCMLPWGWPDIQLSNGWYVLEHLCIIIQWVYLSLYGDLCRCCYKSGLMDLRRACILQFMALLSMSPFKVNVLFTIASLLRGPILATASFYLTLPDIYLLNSMAKFCGALCCFRPLGHEFGFGPPTTGDTDSQMCISP